MRPGGTAPESRTLCGMSVAFSCRAPHGAVWGRYLATRARQGGVPTHAVVGVNAITPFDSRIIDLMEIIEATTREELVAAGRRLALR